MKLLMNFEQFSAEHMNDVCGNEELLNEIFDIYVRNSLIGVKPKNIDLNESRYEEIELKETVGVVFDRGEWLSVMKNNQSIHFYDTYVNLYTKPLGQTPTGYMTAPVTLLNDKPITSKSRVVDNFKNFNIVGDWYLYYAYTINILDPTTFKRKTQCVIRYGQID